MEVRLDFIFLVGEAIGLWNVPCSGRDSNEARLTTDCLFRLRLGAVGRDMRRKGRCVTKGRCETGEDIEPLSSSMEGKDNWAEDDMAWVWVWEMTWPAIQARLPPLD